MATHYIDNEESSSPYYFDQSTPSVGQSTRTTTTTVTTMNPSDYSPYSTGSSSSARIQSQQVKTKYDDDDSYQWTQQQQHQSVAGFNKNVSQQQQYSTSTAAVPQVRATTRQANIQEQQYNSSNQYHSPTSSQNRVLQTYTTYERSDSPTPAQVTSQYHFDSRQTAQNTGSPVYYQSPSSVQHSQHDHDLRTDSPTRVRDQHGQAQQVSVRTTSNTMQQQHDSGAQHHQTQYSPQQVSPQQHQYQYQDQLQQYYSQLTPEQYQQLIRQQQLQRQQQERQRAEYQQTVVTGHTRPNHDGQHYEEYQQRRVYQTSSAQDQHHKQPSQDQYDSFHHRDPQVQGYMSPNPSQDLHNIQSFQQNPNQQTQLEAYYEQQHRAPVQQQSPSSTYTQEQQYRQTTVTNSGGQTYQTVSPQQQQQQQQQQYQLQQQQQYQQQQQQYQQEEDDHEYYAAQLLRQQQQEREHAAQLQAAQRQQAAQHAHQEYQQTVQVDQPTKPVGIRGLMNKFTGPSIVQTYQPKPKASKYKVETTTSYKADAPEQTVTHTKTQYTITYSSLPQPTEPPINSAAYYEMLEKEGNLQSSPNNQSGAPQHIQGPAPGFGALRDRFKFKTSESDDATKQERQFYHSNSGNSSLSMLRDQYVNRAQDASQTQDNSFSQRVQTVTRTVITETHSTTPGDTVTKVEEYQEEVQTQSQSTDDHAVTSEAAVADGNSVSGASSLEQDTTINNNDVESTVVSS